MEQKKTGLTLKEELTRQYVKGCEYYKNHVEEIKSPRWYRFLNTVIKPLHEENMKELEYSEEAKQVADMFQGYVVAVKDRPRPCDQG